MVAKRRRGRPRGQSEKGEQTQATLYETAIRLFAERGYERTTMRAIAQAAGVSPGLLYRYFPGKRAVVHALYDKLSSNYARDAAPLPDGSWTVRFFHAVDVSLEVLGPHRDTLAALTPILIGHESEGLFAPNTSPSRERVMGIFLAAARGADDAPRDDEALGRLLYVAHLGIILSWLLDKSPGQHATMQLLEALAPMSDLASLAMLLPQAAPLLAAGNTFCQRGLFGDEPA